LKTKLYSKNRNGKSFLMQGKNSTLIIALTESLLEKLAKGLLNQFVYYMHFEIHWFIDGKWIFFNLLSSFFILIDIIYDNQIIQEIPRPSHNAEKDIKNNIKKLIKSGMKLLFKITMVFLKEK